MKTTRVPRTQGTNPNGRPPASNVAFVSMCPKCAQVRPQPGYDRNSLLRLLNNGYPLEAYCSMCEEFWSIKAEERAALVAAVVGAGGSFVC